MYELHRKYGRVLFVYGRNPVAYKKELLVTNVKVFQSLIVVAKRFPLDVAGFLNSAGIRKPFTSEAGFLNLPMTGFLNPLWQRS